MPVQNVAPTSEDLAPTGGMSGAKIWGKVIRGLRANKNIMLWVACQEMEAKLVGRTLKIIATDDSGYQAVVKENNLAVLSSIVKSVGDFDVEVVKAGEDSKDGFSNDVEAVKKVFSGVKINVED